MKCHACKKGTLHHKTKPQVYTYKGKLIPLNQPGLWCDSSDEGILTGEDIAKTEKLLKFSRLRLMGFKVQKKFATSVKISLNLPRKKRAKYLVGARMVLIDERGETR